MAIIGSLPVILTNGTIADATQVMADFNYILTQVNANAAPITGGTYLPLAGGTLTGSLNVNGGSVTLAATNTQLVMNKAVGANGNYINASTAGSLRWQLIFGNSTSETGSNVGSDISINRYTDAGAFIDTPIFVKRSTAVTTFSVAIVNGPSDRSLKENIAPLEGSLDKVLALQGVSFSFIDDPEKRRHIGLIAQDVQEIVPEVIQDYRSGDDEPKLALDYPKLVALLIESIKTLTARIEVLEAKLAT